MFTGFLKFLRKPLKTRIHPCVRLSISPPSARPQQILRGLLPCATAESDQHVNRSQPDAFPECTRLALKQSELRAPDVRRRLRRAATPSRMVHLACAYDEPLQ